MGLRLPSQPRGLTCVSRCRGFGLSVDEPTVQLLDVALVVVVVTCILRALPPM